MFGFVKESTLRAALRREHQLCQEIRRLSKRLRLRADRIDCLKEDLKEAREIMDNGQQTINRLHDDLKDTKQRLRTMTQARQKAEKQVRQLQGTLDHETELLQRARDNQKVTEEARVNTAAKYHTERTHRQRMQAQLDRIQNILENGTCDACEAE